ncbi:hypothetical protein AZA_90608 [Nitrospirillum viridazoti Y2]|nr:hypothetical protein AZA_90608 [Nitrospirillum amazonense Y2]
MRDKISAYVGGHHQRACPSAQCRPGGHVVETPGGHTQGRRQLTHRRAGRHHQVQPGQQRRAPLLIVAQVQVFPQTQGHAGGGGDLSHFRRGVAGAGVVLQHHEMDVRHRQQGHHLHQSQVQVLPPQAAQAAAPAQAHLQARAQRRQAIRPQGGQGVVGRQIGRQAAGKAGEIWPQQGRQVPRRQGGVGRQRGNRRA